MTTISMPANPGFIRSHAFWLEPNTQIFTSPLARSTQTFELGGPRWCARYTLRPMLRADAMLWKAFLLQLKGRVNTFYAYDPDCKEPRGVATGTPLVKGAGQTGTSLLIDGCTPNVTGWLLAGDYFTANGEMKQLTQPVNTNGSGEATLYFEPMLRSSPADNAPLTVRNCTVQMILVDDQQGDWESNENGLYRELTFSGYEPLR